MVICSRIEDYKELTNKLHLQTAVVIQPLTDKQVEKYLTDRRMKLHAVYEAVQEDDALRELSQVPLNLNVMALAYEDYSKAQLRPLMADVDNRRQHLYDAYIVRMFRRRPLGDVRYDELKALKWLQYLAVQLTQREETQFFMENLRQSWLPSKTQRHQRWVNSLVVGLGLGLLVGLLGGLFLGLFSGLVSGLFVGLLSGNEYQMTDKVIWTGLRRNNLFFGLFSGLFIGLFFGLIVGLFAGLVDGLTRGLESEQSTNRVRPNQGIRSSIKNGLLVGLLVGLFFGLFAGLVLGLLVGLIVGLLGGLLVGLFAGLVLGLVGGLLAGLTYGAAASINHYLLRFTMHRKKLLPFRLIPFLNDMYEHLLLQNAGAYFRFFHRSMQEHFAALTPEDIDRLVAEIKNTTPSKSRHNS